MARWPWALALCGEMFSAYLPEPRGPVFMTAIKETLSAV
jgi:hypothetical protein